MSIEWTKKKEESLWPEKAPWLYRRGWKGNVAASQCYRKGRLAIKRVKQRVDTRAGDGVKAEVATSRGFIRDEERNKENDGSKIDTWALGADNKAKGYWLLVVQKPGLDSCNAGAHQHSKTTQPVFFWLFHWIFQFFAPVCSSYEAHCIVSVDF